MSSPMSIGNASPVWGCADAASCCAARSSGSALPLPAESVYAASCTTTTLNVTSNSSLQLEISADSSLW